MGVDPLYEIFGIEYPIFEARGQPGAEADHCREM